jgi:PAS domain-containing protein
LRVRTLGQREQELREAKEQAEQAAARITTVFESTTDSVLIIDRGWRITYLNERAKVQLAGGRYIVGMDLWQAFLDAGDTVHANQIRTAMASQRPVSFEAFCQRRNVWFDVNAFPSSEGLAIYFATSPNTSTRWRPAFGSRSSCIRARRWRPSASSRAESPTTSTISWP